MLYRLCQKKTYNGIFISKKKMKYNPRSSLYSFVKFVPFNFIDENSMVIKRATGFKDNDIAKIVRTDQRCLH